MKNDYSIGFITFAVNFRDRLSINSLQSDFVYARCTLNAIQEICHTTKLSGMIVTMYKNATIHNVLSASQNTLMIYFS